MVRIYSKALDKSLEVDRFLGKIEHSPKLPSVIFFAGIHGNETAGIFALEKLFKSLDKNEIQGSVYGITGNLNALSKGRRFLKTDLNRIWTDDKLTRLMNSDDLNSDEQELLEIYKILDPILRNSSAPLYFIDLHTTSSQTPPFITINDALINRKYSRQFPVPIVLGIEEYLDGPLLSFLNTKGYVSIGFESGQHDSIKAISNAEAFIYLALVNSGIISEEKISDFGYYHNLLKEDSNKLRDMFEVIYLHRLSNGEAFKMNPGFKSFQCIEKGTKLGILNSEDVLAPKSAKIFMPLYQKNGNEGFFLIKRIKPFFLNLSEILRKVKADNILALLPGISWLDENKSGLQVNLKVARFMAKPIFHLLGYRNKQLKKTHLVIYNRERHSKTYLYNQLSWFSIRTKKQIKNPT